MFKQPLVDSNKNTTADLTTTTDSKTTTDNNLNNNNSDNNIVSLSDNDMNNNGMSLSPISLKHILNHENIEIKPPKSIATEAEKATSVTEVIETAIISNNNEGNNENRRPRRNRTMKRNDNFFYPSATNAYRLEYKKEDTENDKINTGAKRINNGDGQRSKRQRKVTASSSSNNDNNSSIYVGPGKRKKGVAPRWYTQSYMIFLALREHPTHCLPRTPLIKAALALDEKISKERGLPRVFRSRTPANSASAVLTVNSDRYFIPFKPKESRSTYFKLAYEPCDFNTAVNEYDKWMEKLIQHDWLYCFGIPKPEAIEKRRKEAEEQVLLEQQQQRQQQSSNLEVSNNNNNNNENDNDNNNDNNGNSNDNDNDKVNEEVDSTTTTTTTTMDNNTNHNSTDSTKTVGPVDPLYTLDELNLSNVPKRWQDILKVDKSNIEGAGHGLFATQKLPYNSPLGFYFGVPMTEDEFDSMKESVGKSSEYSIMYRKTVLDATDEKGQPYTDMNGRLYCPFHFMNDANNMESANILFVEGYVVNQVICWTRRDIHPGEELLVWYGKEVNRYWSPSKSSSFLPSSSLSSSISPLPKKSSPSTSSLPSPTPSLSVSSSSVSISSKNGDEESS